MERPKLRGLRERSIRDDVSGGTGSKSRSYNFQMATVLVDAENVRRSLWPNMPGAELEERAQAWAEERGHAVTIVWEGSESGDDQIARLVGEIDPPVWVVTSDRELRERVRERAERIIGGGSFARELRSH
jgi:hypothetical protein